MQGQDDEPGGRSPPLANPNAGLKPGATKAFPCEEPRYETPTQPPCAATLSPKEGVLFFWGTSRCGTDESAAGADTCLLASAFTRSERHWVVPGQSTPMRRATCLSPLPGLKRILTLNESHGSRRELNSFAPSGLNRPGASCAQIRGNRRDKKPPLCSPVFVLETKIRGFFTAFRMTEAPAPFGSTRDQGV